MRLKLTEHGLIVVGEIVGVHGVNGELRLLPHTDFPERFRPSTRLYIDTEKGLTSGLHEATVVSSRYHRGLVLLKLSNVNTREHAKQLIGSKVKVPRSEVEPLSEGSYYVFQIIGMQVMTTSGTVVGTVSEVIRGPANDVYVVQAPEGGSKKEILVPAVKEIVREIDPEKGIMVIKPIAGLLGEARED